MTIIRKWSGDGLSAGALSTSTAGTGDNAFNVINGGGGFTVATGGPRSPQISFPATAAAHQLRWNGLNLTAWGLRRYFTVSAVPAATWSLFTGIDSVGGDLFRCEVNSTGLLRFRSATAAVYSPSTNAIVAATVYRVELIGATDGSAHIYLYAGESSTPLLDSAATVTAGNLAEIRWGHQSAVAVSGETADDLAVADVAALIGAAGTPPGDPVGVIREWSGDGLSAGALSTGSAGTGDDAFDYVGAGMVIETASTRTPRIGFPTTAGAHQVRWAGFTPTGEFAIRRQFGFATMPAATVQLAEGRDGSGNQVWRVEMTAGGLLRLRNSTTNTWSQTGIAVTAAESWRLEVTGAAGSATVRLYRRDYTTARASGTGAIETGDVAEVRFGHTLSVAATGEWADDLAFANTSDLIGPKVDGGAEPAPVTTRTWGGDGLTAGTLTTSSAGTGDTAFTTVTGGLTVEASGPRSPQIRIPDAAAVKRVHWYPLTATTGHAARWYQTFGALSPAETYLANALNAGADVWSVRLTSTGLIRFRDDNAGTVRWTAAAVIPLNTRIRFELVVPTSGVCTLTAYRGDFDVVIATGTGTLNVRTVDEVRFGFSSSVASTGITYDDVAFRNEATAIGPADLPAPPYTHFRTIGGVWVPQDVILL